MMPDHNQILRFVEDCLPDFGPYGNPERLSGGNLNLVWRITGQDRSMIVKYSPPYIASSPDIPMNSNRLRFEANALEAFLPGASLSQIATEKVNPPGFLGFDEKDSLLLMEDISPAKPWFDALESGEADFASAFELGKFIGKLHRETYSNTLFSDRFDNQPVQSTRNLVQYQSLSKKLLDRQDKHFSLAGQRCKQLGELLLRPGRCLVMGDLWPPSLLWSSYKIRIIDWEFVHFGRPLQDLAHFCAHCMMHHAVASSENQNLFLNIWARMIDGYRKETAHQFQELLNEEELKWFPVHIGAEILARTIGAFSEGYLFDNPLHQSNREIIIVEAVHLMAGTSRGKLYPFINLI